MWSSEGGCGTGATDATASTVELVLVDDDAIVRAWVRAAVSGTEFRLAGEAERGADAVNLVERRRPDILLVDQLLPDWTGTELVKELRRRGWQMPVVLMTSAPREGLNEAAREAGVQGTVVKSAEVDVLLATLRSVADGESAIHAPHPPAARRVQLSSREREILQLVAAGRSNNQIAALLDISAETVKTMLYRAFEKLGVHRRSEAVAEAHRRGLLDRPPDLES
jgi:NarL family two-component system response regulator LiaR